jgi:glyoxylase-like metal-dependent hydrolase (beta-lactamase superfamily II)
MPDILPLRPGLWLTETAVEGFHVRGAVVAGRTLAVIWDTLARPAHMEGVAELAPEVPLTVVYSHGDWDHVWGTVGLSRPWTEVLAHEACLARFSGLLPGLPVQPSSALAGPVGTPFQALAIQPELPSTLEKKRKDFPGEYDDVVLVPPTRTFRDPIALDLGGITLELHPFPGHTPDTVVGLIPEWGILLGGDAVESPLPFLNPGSPVNAWAKGLEDWARSLEDWAAGGALHRPLSAEPTGRFPGGPPGTTTSLVVPSHGPVGGPELLCHNARYLRALLEGKEPDLPPDLPPFYVHTHEANRALARQERDPPTPGPRDQLS